MNQPSRKPDFPIWLPPAVVKELRQNLRGIVFPVILAIFPAALALLFMGNMPSDNPDDPRAYNPTQVNTLFWFIFAASLVAILPMRAISSVGSEVKNKTSDLLVLTKLTPVGIIWGKWASYFLQTLLVTITLLPFIFIRYYYSSVNLFEDLYWTVLIVIASGVSTALAIWISGTSNLIRIPFMIGVITASFGLTALIVDSDLFETLSYVWFLLGILLVDGGIIVMIFIFLSARWFSPPVDNLSRKTRLALLAWCVPLLIPGLGYWMEWMTPENAGQLLAIHVVIASVVTLFTLIIELNSPPDFLPVHASRKKKSFSGFLHNLFLVPGFFSASAFSLLALAGGAALMCMLMSKTDLFPISHTAYPLYQYQMQAAYTAILIWMSLIIPSFLLLKSRKKFKMGTPFMYGVLCGLGVIISYLFLAREWDTAVMFIPWANIFLDPESVAPGLETSLQSPTYILGAWIVFLISLLCVTLKFNDWRKTIKTADELDYLAENPADRVKTDEK